MTLSTHAGLIASIGDNLDRDDVATVAEDWIALAEARMNIALRVNQMISRDTATISAGFSVVPTDFLAPRQMRLVASPFSLLSFLTQEQMADFQGGSPSGSLKFYTLVGGEFEFAPIPTDDVDVVLTYFARIPALSEDNPTNWVLDSFPQAYLRGALFEAGLYMRDNDLATSNEQLFEAAVESIRKASRSDLAFNLTPTPSAVAV